MRLFGLIGFPLTHSFSKQYFDKKFSDEGIKDCAFENFPIKEIEEVKQLLDNEQLRGFAVTIPYKKKIIRFLDEGTDTVKQMVACNCVKLVSGKLKGYNTDVIGFDHSFKKLLQPHHRKALILGTGGAASAAEFVLHSLGIEYVAVSRTPGKKHSIAYSEITKEIIQEYNVIINCTPLGTYPKVEECPGIPYQFITPRHYLFDMVYNPEETVFLKKGKEQGAIIKNGYEMLTIQAEENWKIWNS